MSQNMNGRPGEQPSRKAILLLAGLCALGGGLLLGGFSGRVTANQTQLLKTTGVPRLVSVQPLPEMESGEMCQFEPASAQTRLVAGLQQERAAARSALADEPSSGTLDRAPLRVIHDPYATLSAVAVDSQRNEIVIQDENLYKILVYDRSTNTPPSATMSEPKRMIGGPLTKIEFNCGLYIDPKNGDIYSIANDTIDTMVVFSRNARGNVKPDRELHTPHRTFGIAVNEEAQELFLTIQDPAAVVVYPKLAKADDAPVRVIEGDHTQLADPHGISLDIKRKLVYVSNHGSVASSKDGKNFTRQPISDGKWQVPNEGVRRRNMKPGSGRFEAPSITVYALDAKGDAAPVRKIEGPKTQLNWPAQIYLDEEHDELFVANDVGDSVLVFRASDNGDAAPVRVIKGPKTWVKNPTGIFVDTKNQELVVANMGSHATTVFPRTANGDVAPVRLIRAAPQGTPALMIGNPGAVAYDTKRDQILVPN